jgi:hypothetical protein
MQSLFSLSKHSYEEDDGAKNNDTATRLRETLKENDIILEFNHKKKVGQVVGEIVIQMRKQRLSLVDLLELDAEQLRISIKEFWMHIDKKLDILPEDLRDKNGETRKEVITLFKE